MFVDDNQIATSENLERAQIAIIRKFSIMLFISGIFGTVYMILSGFPYLGNYLFFGLPSYLPPVPFHILSPTFIAFSSLIISYVFLSSGVFFLSNLYKKVYYSKRRRLFYRGILYLNTAYLVYLIGAVIGIMAVGISTNTNQPSQVFSFIFSIVFFYTLFSFFVVNLLVLYSFGSRTGRYSLMLFAFLAASDIYFIPIIAGAFGYLITSSYGDVLWKYLMDLFTPKIRKIESGINKIQNKVNTTKSNIISRIEQSNRNKYKKYVYPALILSLLATGILLYYSFVITSYNQYGYEYYNHPYYYGPIGIFNAIGLTLLITIIFALIKYLNNSERVMKLAFSMPFLIASVITIFILILKWVFFKDYPTGELNAYMFTEYYLYLSLAAASIITKNKTVKKSENLTNDLTQQ